MIKEGNETVTNCDTFKFKAKYIKIRNEIDQKVLEEKNKKR